MLDMAQIEISLQRALKKTLENGGEFADVFVEDRYAEAISVDNGKVDPLLSGIIRGAGIRLIRNGSVFFFHTEDLTEEGLLQAATALARLGRSAPMDSDFTFTTRLSRSVSQVIRYPTEVDHSVKIDLLFRAQQAALEVDPLGQSSVS